MAPTTPNPSPSAVSISGDLIGHVYTIHELERQRAASKPDGLHPDNPHARHALPAYILAVAAIEALINETLLGMVSRSLLSSSALWELDREWLQDLEIRRKLVFVPKLLLGTTLDKGKQPFQDFALLTSIRNALVHYKMSASVPKAVEQLAQRGIVVTAPRADATCDYTWPDKLKCLGGIRWAHDTACAVARGLESLISAGPQKDALTGTFSNFRTIGGISDKSVRA
jgi:hypothetical protein